MHSNPSDIPTVEPTPENIIQLFIDHFPELEGIVNREVLVFGVDTRKDITLVCADVRSAEYMGYRFILKYNMHLPRGSNLPQVCQQSYVVDTISGGKHGRERYYFPCGCVKSDVTWNKGIREGNAVLYQMLDDTEDTDPALHVFGRYWNDKRHGIWHWYDAEGDIELSVEYHTGKVLVVKHDKRKGEVHPTLN